MMQRIAVNTYSNTKHHGGRYVMYVSGGRVLNKTAHISKVTVLITVDSSLFLDTGKNHDKTEHWSGK
jgi:hypothetical protein